MSIPLRQDCQREQVREPCLRPSHLVSWAHLRSIPSKLVGTEWKTEKIYSYRRRPSQSRRLAIQTQAYLALWYLILIQRERSGDYNRAEAEEPKPNTVF